MALVYGDRVKETTTSTGTGDISLAGAVAGFQTFGSVLSDSDTCYYVITDDSDWEIGLGTYSANTLTRTTVLDSSNADTKVNWGVGSKTVFLTLPASRMVDTSHTHTESQISDLGTYLTDITGQAITQLSDVYTLMSPTDGQALIYDTTNGWQAETLSITESQISDLGTYLTDAPSDGSQYAREDGAWAVVTGGGGGASQLSDLSDVNTSTATNRNVLVADGTDFESRALVEADISDLQTYSTATGVEDNADVTDTANVTAAGALMDSEVTNLAQVKAFDSTDYATAAQGALADSATQPGDLATVATSGAYSDLSGTPTIPTVDDTAYNATTWNANTDAPTKNAVRDKIETIDSDIAGKADSSHTHTASDITDFDTEVSNNASVTANTAKVSYTDAAKVAGIEDNATADQSDAEIETAYNNQVAQVSSGERTAGTETAIRRFSPADIASMAGTHGGGGGGGSNTYYGTSESYFQVEDDGTTGQLTTGTAADLTGIWATPSLTDATDFSWNGTTGILTVNTSGTVEFDVKVNSYNNANNRHELHIQLYKNGTTVLTEDAQYASRNNTQDEGGAYIHGFKDTATAGDTYRVRVFDIGVAATVGASNVAGQTYISATLKKVTSNADSAFRAYHNTTQTSGNATFAAMSFNTEDYDEGSDFASSEFTAPADGIYHFDARAHVSGAHSRFLISLYKDTGGGYSETARGVDHAATSSSQASGTGANVSADLKLNSGDKIRVYSFGSSALTIASGSATTYFSGHLVRLT